MLLISSSIILLFSCVSLSLVSAALDQDGDQDSDLNDDQDGDQDSLPYEDTAETESQELDEESLYEDFPEDGNGDSDSVLQGDRLVGSFKGKIEGEFKSPTEFRVSTASAISPGNAAGRDKTSIEHTLKAESFKGRLKGSFTPQNRQQASEIDTDVNGAVIGKWMTGNFVCTSQSNTVNTKTSSSKSELETKGSCGSGNIFSEDFQGDFVGSRS